MAVDLFSSHILNVRGRGDGEREGGKWWPMSWDRRRTERCLWVKGQASCLFYVIFFQSFLYELDYLFVCISLLSFLFFYSLIFLYLQKPSFSDFLELSPAFVFLLSFRICLFKSFFFFCVLIYIFYFWCYFFLERKVSCFFSFALFPVFFLFDCF